MHLPSNCSLFRNLTIVNCIPSNNGCFSQSHFTFNTSDDKCVRKSSCIKITCYTCSCYMVVGNFNGIDSVLKIMSHCASHLQWVIRFVTCLNPIESLWRRSSECKMRFVPRDLSHKLTKNIGVATGF